MKLQSNIFVLFLVASTFLSTRSLAQTRGIQPKSELEASQEANLLGEEVRRSEPHAGQVQKGENRSADAMHWKFTAINQPIASENRKPINKKQLPSRASAYEQVNKSVKPAEKPIYNWLERLADRDTLGVLLVLPRLELTTNQVCAYRAARSKICAMLESVAKIASGL